MSQDKNSSTNTEETPSKRPEEILVEKQLIPRLRFMGMLLLFFSGCALCYSLFFAAEIDEALAIELADDGFSAPREMQYSANFDLLEVETFNPYIITISFAVVGATCLLLAWNRQKHLKEK